MYRLSVTRCKHDAHTDWAPVTSRMELTDKMARYSPSWGSVHFFSFSSIDTHEKGGRYVINAIQPVSFTTGEEFLPEFIRYDFGDASAESRHANAE